MSKKVTAWQIIEEMSNRNQKVWLAPLSNIVSVQSNKKNGKVEFGIPLEMSNALLNNPRNNGGFLLIDSEQYDAMQKELESKETEDLDSLRSKAKLWDKLKTQIDEFYLDVNGDFSEDNPVNNGGLDAMGEIVGIAMGWL